MNKAEIERLFVRWSMAIGQKNFVSDNRALDNADVTIQNVLLRQIEGRVDGYSL